MSRGGATVLKLGGTKSSASGKFFWSVPPKSSKLGGVKSYYWQYFGMQPQMTVNIGLAIPCTV